MFSKKSFFIFFILILQTFHAQRKKADTVYVYEKVIVYDTVYLEKALKIQPAGISIKLPPVWKTEITEMSFFKDEVKGAEVKLSQRFQFGAGIEAGIKKGFWSKGFSEKDSQSGFGAGIWASKPIYKRFSVMLSAHIYHWNSTFDLDANKEDTWLNGFYFSEDRQPLLFQKFNNKHFEYNLQLKLLYDWNNIRPFAGFLVSKNTYKMQFLVPENKVLSKLDDFKSDQINFGFSLGIQYLLLKKFLVSLEYQEYKMKNIRLKNSDFNFDIFKTNNTFAERKINLGISYIISGR
ncbi:outer membrane beta-barrel protein [Chryseobacterium arthrosphaerae]|uniref:outer membrane beta-barrel protein n=1 Tax=Chryseobacterium arthrosphaerae TaxID=651561 RepID=UPI003D34C78F